MKQRLKVYGVNLDGRHRGIVAATSLRSAASLFGISQGHARAYASQTWNREEVEVAMSKPGTAFRQSYRAKKEIEWEEMTR